MGRQWTFQKHLLSPLQALDMLCRTLYAEGLPEACDYLGLHMPSTQVLLSMYESLQRSFGCDRYKSDSRRMIPTTDLEILLGLWKNATNLQLKRYITTLGA